MILLLKRERHRQHGDTRTSGVRSPRQRGLEAVPMTVRSCDPLTEREIDVLELLDAQLSNKEVATCLVISLPAVQRVRTLGFVPVRSGVEPQLGTGPTRAPVYLLRPREAVLTEASTVPQPAVISRCDYRTTLCLVERSSRSSEAGSIRVTNV